jgi:hypothetical protein
MNMLNRLVVSYLCLMFCTPVVCPQQIIFDVSKEAKAGSGYQQAWDPNESRLISYRDVSDAALPAVQVSSANGKKVSFYPVRDLGATYIDIWAVSGSPDGGVVISAILGFGPRNSRPVPVKSVLLTYDATGTLRSVWNIEPYHYHSIAADSNGNVYAFGHTDSDSKDYSLLIKYSPAGQILGEYLSSRLFSNGDKVAIDHHNGENVIFIKNDHLFVWIAATQEMFTFSVDGSLVSRTSLSSALTNMANSTDSARANVLEELRSDAAHRVIAQVQLWPKDGSLARLALARITANGSFESWVEPPGPSAAGHRFLGLTSDDKPVFLEKLGPTAVTTKISP